MIARQALSFAVIGLSVNFGLYAAYLVLTHTLLGSFAAMTVTYCSGVVMGFALNRRYTFGFGGDGGAAFLRYLSPTSAAIWSISPVCGCLSAAGAFPTRSCRGG